MIIQSNSVWWDHETWNLCIHGLWGIFRKLWFIVNANHTWGTTFNIALISYWSWKLRNRNFMLKCFCLLVTWYWVPGKKGLHMSQVAHQARAYPGFCGMKWLGVFYSPLDGMLVHRRVTPRIRFSSTHLYIWAERGTVPKNTMHCSQPGLKPTQAEDKCTNHEVTA